MSRKTRALTSFFRYFLALVMLAWVINQANWDTVLTLLPDISPTIIVLLLLVTLAGVLSRFYTWHVLLNQLKAVDFRRSIEIDLIINFVNHVLPSRLGGRSLGPLVVRQTTGISWGESVGVVGVSTGLYAVLYGSFSLLGLAISFDRYSVGLLLLILLSVSLYLIVGFFILVGGFNVDYLDGLIAYLERKLSRVPKFGDELSSLFRKAPDFTADSVSVFRGTFSDPKAVLLYSLGWVGALMVFPAMRFSILLEIMDVGFEPLLFLPIILVMAYSVTLLPLTPGGIGVAEATATIVFVSLGLPEGTVASVVLLDRFIGVYVPAVFGWYPAMKLNLPGFKWGS